MRRRGEAIARSMNSILYLGISKTVLLYKTKKRMKELPFLIDEVFSCLLNLYNLLKFYMKMSAKNLKANYSKIFQDYITRDN